MGGGGREHALAWRLAQEAEVFCAPGNPGIAEDVQTLDIKTSDTDGLVKAARELRVDAVVVGPEDPLVNGLADALRDAGVPVYGPDAAGARLESSKAFSKKLMAEAGVPTAAFATFTDAASALDYARERYDAGAALAVKASGNALGKGVVVAETYEEAEDAIRRMMEAREFGEAGATVVLEERLVGPEFSLLTMVSDAGIRSLPVAKDHKRAFDGDTGPNTGGMGAFAPVASVSADIVAQMEERVVRPVLDALANRGIGYRGTLFSGLMVHSDGEVKCLEYNVRFGDPETQTLMRLVGKGFAEAVLACAHGASIPEFEVSSSAAVTVVVASGGYPGDYEKGLSIEIGPLPEGTKLFHAGTATSDGNLVTAGGRVIAASAVGKNLDDARVLAYKAAEAVRFEGTFFRKDIAHAAQN